jgi:hypothetical protein
MPSQPVVILTANHEASGTPSLLCRDGRSLTINGDVEPVSMR